MKIFRFSYQLGISLAAAMLVGCVTQMPTPITGNLRIAEIQADPTQFKGSEIRWGGVITGVENKSSNTWVEVVSLALNSNGKPLPESDSGGRFIANFSGFSDPVVYSNDRLLTITGTVTNVIKRTIGEYNYSFPVVTVSTSHLWPIETAESPVSNTPPPWWYYDPWPLYPRPYSFYPHHHR